MSEKLNNIYHPSNCLSQQQLFDYIDNKLDHQQKRFVEHHFLDCELCSDAMEGLSMLKNREIAYTVSQKLKAELIEKETKVVPLYWFQRNYKLMAAASILLLIVFGLYFFQIVSTKEKQMAEVITKSPKLETEKSEQIFDGEKGTPTTVVSDPENVSTTPSTIVKKNSVSERSAAGEKTLKPVNTTPVPESAPEVKGPSQLTDKVIEAEQQKEFVQNGGVAENSTADDAYKKEDFANAKSKTLREEDSEKSREAKKASSVVANKKDKTKSIVSEERGMTQAPAAGVASDESMDIAITAPTYPGGEKALRAFILKNKKTCESCSVNVKVNFIVEADGSLKNIKVENEDTTCACAVSEAKRLMALMPKWNPGEVRGNKQAALSYVIINF